MHKGGIPCPIAFAKIGDFDSNAIESMRRPASCRKICRIRLQGNLDTLSKLCVRSPAGQAVPLTALVSVSTKPVAPLVNPGSARECRQPRSGDGHVYAGRSRFIPASLCEHFRRVIWPAARREEVRPPATNAAINIRERMRGM